MENDHPNMQQSIMTTIAMYCTYCSIKTPHVSVNIEIVFKLTFKL